ncbi:MAG: hypothetical protein NZ959_11670 [Armatimonadetes bacterium]|nr:hypothetical protein [Armatimonadota bacterium]MDW8122981.1 hypothetical protein [Armatimonadota bacterium]
MKRGFIISILVLIVIGPGWLLSQKAEERIKLGATAISAVAPKGWRTGVAGNFPYIPGEFVAGWRKPRGFGYAAIIVATQRPPQPLTLADYAPLMAKVLTERFKATDLIVNHEADLPFGRTTWVSGTAPGVGMHLGGGEIMTRALWITSPLGQDLVTFYFACPVPAYSDLIDEFKAFVDSVQIPGPLGGLTKPIPAFKETSLLSPDQWQALEAIAKEEGVDVGVLLRKIVDDFIKSRKKR